MSILFWAGFVSPTQAAQRWRDRIKATATTAVATLCKMSLIAPTDGGKLNTSATAATVDHHARLPLGRSSGSSWHLIGWAGTSAVTLTKNIGWQISTAVEIVRREMMDVEDWIKIVRRSIPPSIGASFANSSSSRPHPKGRGSGPSPAGLFDWF